MLRNLIRGSIPKGNTRITSTNISLLPIRYNSTLSQTKLDLASNGNEEVKTKPVVNIDELLSNSIPFNEDSYISSERLAYDTVKQPTPREVAKSHRVVGTNSGRTVEIDYHNVSRGFNQIRRLVNDNKIRYLERIQARYIKPAKLRKQQKSEHWRAHFKKHFKETLGLIKDAKRRGY